MGILLTGAGATNNVVGGAYGSQGNRIWDYVFAGVRLDSAGAATACPGTLSAWTTMMLRTGGVAGIRVIDTPGTVIGGADDWRQVPGPGDGFQLDFALGNVVVDSGEFGEGIRLDGATTTGTVVAGNNVGTTADAEPPDLGQRREGIEANGASNNQLGPGNRVAFNAEAGIAVSNASGNRIVANSIFANGGQGIELGGGANTGIGAPALTSATTSDIVGSSSSPGFLEILQTTPATRPRARRTSGS